jgi:hypothetical protein
MKNIVITLQDVNWDDDGGDHDAALISVSDQDFGAIGADASSDTPVDYARRDALRDIVRAAVVPTLPCEIHGVFNIWSGS